MTIVNVKYITNGYIVRAFGSAQQLDSVYAGTIPEVVYWVGRMFDPITGAAPPLTRTGPAPQIIDNTDPLLNQEAQVEKVASGGFLTRQQGGLSGAKQLEIYCVDLDAVSTALTQIYTPPEPPAALTAQQETQR